MLYVGILHFTHAHIASLLLHGIISSQCREKQRFVGTNRGQRWLPTSPGDELSHQRGAFYVTLTSSEFVGAGASFQEKLARCREKFMQFPREILRFPVRYLLRFALGRQEAKQLHQHIQLKIALLSGLSLSSVDLVALDSEVVKTRAWRHVPSHPTLSSVRHKASFI